MKRPNPFLLLGLAAGLFCVLGAWLEERNQASNLRRRLQSDAVPTPLLDIGKLGALLQRNDLVEEIGNDETLFPITTGTGELDESAERLVFRRKSRVGASLYRANPSREPDFPASALPPEERARGAWTIVSVAIDEDDLRGEDGILTRFRERIERRAHTTFYRAGVELFSTRAGLKLHGGGSRLPERKSSYRLHLRDRYGSSAFPPAFLFEGRIDPVSTLILRRTTGFTSVLGYDLARKIGSPVPHFEPCLLFLNKEAQGIHFLTERLSREQLATRFGHDNFLVYRLRGTSNGKSLEARDRLLQWLLELGDEATAQRVGRYIDVDALSRYLLAIAFCGTDDWEQGAALLDLADPHDRWKWIHWDMDLSFYSRVKKQADMPAFGLILDPPHHRESIPARVLKTLFKNDADYRRFFGELTTEVLNHLWTPEFLRSAAARYGDLELSLGTTSAMYDTRIPFLEQRAEYVLEDLRERLELGALLDCEIRTERQVPVELEVDGYAHATPYAGRYYAGQTVRARITGADASRHAGWLVAGERLPAGTLELVLEEDSVITVLFD